MPNHAKSREILQVGRMPFSNTPYAEATEASDLLVGGDSDSAHCTIGGPRRPYL